MDAALRALLRPHPEPWTWHDDAAIHGALTADPLAYLDHLDAALEAIAAGRWQVELPSKQVFGDPGEAADFRVMPCVVRRPDGVTKTVKLVGTNTNGTLVPDQITVGRAFLLHPAENFVQAGFAACLLSSARTGACAAIALRRLDAPCHRLGVTGCGRVGFYAALYAGLQGRPAEILLHDARPGRAAALAAALAPWLPGVRCRAVAAPETAETVILATAGMTPAALAPGPAPAVVVSLGADTAWQREVDPVMAGGYRIFVDTLDSLRCGDLAAWCAAGLVDSGAVTDLLALVRDGRAGDEPALFISTGSALLDNLTIDYLGAAAGGGD